MDQQQQQIAALLQALTQATQALSAAATTSQTNTNAGLGTTDTSTNLFCKINGLLSDFNYSPENDQTFDLWLSRYENFITKDGATLSEEAKVRLVIGKLSPINYKQYAESILPAKTHEVSYVDSITKLKSLFCDTKSIFVRRYEAFMAKQRSTDPLEFADAVNAQWERAEVSTITAEELKTLTFISGLKDEHTDYRLRALKKLEE